MVKGYVNSNWKRVDRSMLEIGGSVVLYERNQWRQHKISEGKWHQGFCRLVHFGQFEVRSKEACN